MTAPSSPPSPSPETPARRSPVLAAAVVGVVIVGIIALLASRDGDGGDTGVRTEPRPETGVARQEVRAVKVSGTPLPELAGKADDAAVGAPVPTIEGQSFDGTAVTIGGSGTPQLVFVVAHWCPHCQKEVPVITEWIEKGSPAGIDLRAISTGVSRNAPNYPPSAWLEREGWTVPTIADDEKYTAGAALGLSGYPFFVAIRADGTVAARASGELTVDQIEALVALAKR